MKIGVFSDSHDHMVNIEKAAKIFADRGVEKVVHCGDFVAPFIKWSLGPLQGKSIETIGIYGNNDGERIGLKKILGEVVQIMGELHECEWQGKKIVVYHGTDVRILDALIDCQKYDLVLTGHTHQIRVEKKQKALVVNPGETCGYLTGKATCAIIDLSYKTWDIKAVEIVEITPPIAAAGILKY